MSHVVLVLLLIMQPADGGRANGAVRRAVEVLALMPVLVAGAFVRRRAVDGSAVRARLGEVASAGGLLPLLLLLGGIRERVLRLPATIAVAEEGVLLGQRDHRSWFVGTPTARAS